jgi:site-specific DNA-methyltransferase (adenine-specific)/adenine-specific DNA-methyltransferase
MEQFVNKIRRVDWQSFPYDLLKAYKGQVQMIYMDPPFATGRQFFYRDSGGEKQKSYRDTNLSDTYWQMMRVALMSAKTLLKDDGCIFTHVDFRVVAQTRLLMDDIFGEKNFLNEIIWHYQSGGRSKRYFSRKHDTILFYKKGRAHAFYLEAVGKRQGAERHNHMKKEVDAAGKVSYTIKSAGKIYRYGEDRLTFPDDVWTDIPHIQQKSPERTGYPTQKPLALLERIIKATTAEGDLVADLFAGSGTTGAAAHQLNRHFLLCDNNPQALQVCCERLSKLGAAFEEETYIESTK